MLQSFRNKSSVQIALVGLFNLIKGGGIMNINWFSDDYISYDDDNYRIRGIR